MALTSGSKTHASRSKAHTDRSGLKTSVEILKSGEKVAIPAEREKLGERVYVTIPRIKDQMS